MQTERIYQKQEQPSIEQTPSANATWFLLIMSLVAVIPFWTVRYPVVTDYPNHLGRWFVLFHMKDGGLSFWGLLRSGVGPFPVCIARHFGDGIAIFLTYRCCRQMHLSVCIILVGFATYFFLKKACPGNVELASFGILVAFNPNFLIGSISNQFSLAFCLLVVGLWLSYCKAPKVMTAVGIVMGVYALFQEQRWKKVGILAVLSLPALLIFAYNPSHAGTGCSFVYAGLSSWHKLRNLFFPVQLFTSKNLDLILLASLAFLIFLVLKKRAIVALQPVWLTVCAILLLAYLAAPGEYGFGGYIDLRIMPFLYLFLLAVIISVGSALFIYRLSATRIVSRGDRGANVHSPPNAS